MSLLPVKTLPRRLAAYDGLADSNLIEQIRSQAMPLRGLRVVHINATPAGGGVSEILRSIVPLMCGLGLDARWYVLPPDDAFFGVTKKLHNWLQGKPGRLTRRDRDTYLRYQQSLAQSMRRMGADVWVIHDPQPLALAKLVPVQGATIWRCHIDCSEPNPAARDFLLPWVRGYDRALFSMPDYAFPGLERDQIKIVHPAIDPLTPKNQRLEADDCRQIIAELGIDPTRPLMSQISRFDPWKNPWQVVDTYRLAKRSIPGLQLAMLGVFEAKDDPEGPRIYRQIRRYAGNDPDVHLYTDPARIGPRQVNAFQSTSAVMLQRSTREGFGLTVTEAMWKARPVVATPVGGITAQIQHGESGYLVSTTEDCAELVVDLVQRPDLAETIGLAARKRVSADFLLPRLVHDDLRNYHELTHMRSMEAAA